MTHDELIDIIEKHQNAQYEPHTKGVTAWDILQSVVELHKPYGSETKGFVCEFCMDRAAPMWVYPCPTIQTIQKELG